MINAVYQIFNKHKPTHPSMSKSMLVVALAEFLVIILKGKSYKKNVPNFKQTFFYYTSIKIISGVHN